MKAIVNNSTVRHLIVILGCLLATIACLAEKYTKDVLMHKLHSPGTDINLKLAYVDSLLGMNIKDTDRDSLLILKADLATSLCAYDKILSAYNELGDDRIATLPLDVRCRIMYDKMIGLARSRGKVESLVLGDKLYNIRKPDSLIYYNAQVDYMRFNFLLPINPEMATEYVADVENIYATAKKKNLSKTTLNNIYKILLEMQSNKALKTRDYRKALSINNKISELPMTQLEKLSYDQNMGLLYIFMGEFDEAEKIFKESLGGKIFHYNHGVALMNYTHMLNLQGRYQESIDVVNRHPEALDVLNRDMYYSYVLANKADALANLGLTKEAYDLMYESRLMADSIYENNKEIEGVRLIDYFTASRKSEQAEKRVRVSNVIISIIGILLLIMIGLILYMFRLIAKRRKENVSLNADISQERERHQQLIDKIRREHSIQESKNATTSLKLVDLEERYERIKEIIADRSLRNEAKMKMLSKLTGNVSTSDDSIKLFQEQMENIHSQFLQRLLASHPDLTRTETQICCYIIMNMSSKEIAQMTNRTTRAVESVRYRIGKKLNIPGNEAMLTYLRKFM